MNFRSGRTKAFAGLRRVLVVQRVLPTYRVRFFEALSASPNLAVTVASGEVDQRSALRGGEATLGIARWPLHNAALRLGGREIVAFQSGMIPAINATDPDVIIAEFNLRIVSNLLLWMIARYRRRPLILWGHGFGKSGGAVSRRLRLFFAHSAAAMIFYGKHQRDEFASAGVDPKKLFVARNTIDIDPVVRLAKRSGWGERHRIIVVGRVLREKKVDVTIKAFAQAHQDLPATTVLTIIGDGPETGRLRQLAQRLGIAKRVEFTGALYVEPQIAQYFNEALVSVSSGYVGLGIIHSFAYGVPMLIAREEPHSPEIEALEDGRNGLFFPSNDPSILAACFREIINDRPRLQWMGQEARATVTQEYSVSSMVCAFEQAVEWVTQ